MAGVLHINLHQHVLVLLSGVWQLVVADSFSGKVTVMPFKGKASQFIERFCAFQRCSDQGVAGKHRLFFHGQPCGELAGRGSARSRSCLHAHPQDMGPVLWCTATYTRFLSSVIQTILQSSSCLCASRHV